jgi:hypothetical protein
LKQLVGRSILLDDDDDVLDWTYRRCRRHGRWHGTASAAGAVATAATPAARTEERARKDAPKP